MVNALSRKEWLAPAESNDGAGRVERQRAIGNLRCRRALARAREMILDSERDCVERVNAAWQELRHVSVEDMPPALRPEWTAIARRATRLAEGSPGLATPDRHGEAANIGSIFLCFDWLLRQTTYASTLPTPPSA